VWQLAQHYQRRPDQLSDEDLRQYFLYLANEKKIARPAATISLCKTNRQLTGQWRDRERQEVGLFFFSC